MADDEKDRLYGPIKPGTDPGKGDPDPVGGQRDPLGKAGAKAREDAKKRAEELRILKEEEEKKSRTKEYAGSGMLGTARSVGEKIDTLQLISQFWGGSVESGKAIIRRFMGIFTKPGRDHAPLGALEDVRNLEPNVKTGALTLRKGSSSYASTFVDSSGLTTLTQIDDFFPLSTEVPTATDIDIVLGQTSGNVKHVFQKPFWQHQIKVNGYVNYNERLATTVDGSVSYPNATTFTVVEGALGGEYLKDWFCYFPDRNSGPYLVKRYESGEVEVTPQLSTGIQTGDAVLFFRFPLFDDTFTLPVQYSTIAGKSPVCLQQGQAVLFSGGQSSLKSHRALWSGYIGRTWLLGATNALDGIYTGRTEVSWADVPLKTQTNIGNVVLSPLTVGTLAPHGTTPELCLSEGTWFAGIVPQTDDGILGLPIITNAATVSALAAGAPFGYGVAIPLTLRLPTFNKRVRYLNIVLGKAPNTTDTSIQWDNLYVVKTLDLEDGTDWTYTETATTVLGSYSIEVVLDKSDWDASGVATKLPLFMGSNEPSGTELSFSIAKFHTNRLFVAKYHDFSDGVDYNDHIRFSGVSGDGFGQVNFLTDAHIDGTSVTSVDVGDATSIQALEKWEDKLFVIKDSSCGYIPITSDEPSRWAYITVSPYIGCTAPKTLGATPYGIMWCQPGDDVYIWDGGSPVSMTQDTWRETFKALTYAANWTGWYSTAKKCYSFFDSVTGIWWSMYFEVPISDGIYSWYKYDIPNTDSSEATHYFDSIVKFTNTRSGEEYYIYKYVDGITGEGDTGTTHYRIAYINSSATSDVDAEGIVPYFKTAPILLDESSIAQVHHWYIANESAGVGEFLPFCVLAVGSNSQSYIVVSSATFPPFMRRGVLHGADTGRLIQLTFNGLRSAIFTSLTINQIGFEYKLKPFVGDKTITS